MYFKREIWFSWFLITYVKNKRKSELVFSLNLKTNSENETSYFFSRFNSFHDSLLFEIGFLVFFYYFIVLVILVDEFIVFLLDFFFVLIDHLFVTLLLFLQVVEFFLAVEKVLRVEISIGTHSFVEMLLMLELSENGIVLLLLLSDLINLDFDFLASLVILCMCLRSFDTVFFLFFLELCNHFTQFLILSFVSENLILNLFQFVQLVNDVLIRFMLVILGFFERFIVLTTLLQNSIDSVF